MTVPCVVGALRPVLLIPLAVVTQLTPAQLEVLLAHELAHIRRYDHIINLLQRVVEAFLFFHPGVWYVSRRIRLEREVCCDELVLSTGAGPTEYAASLVKVAKLSQAIAADAHTSFRGRIAMAGQTPLVA